MSRKSSYLSIELEESAGAELKKMGSSALVAKKLEAIKAACKYGISEVAKISGVTRKTLLFWIKNFQKTRIENLKAPPNRHRKSILNDDEREIIKGIIEKAPQVTIDFLIEKVLELYGKKISRSSMHREVKKLRHLHIMSCPKHNK